MSELHPDPLPPRPPGHVRRRRAKLEILRGVEPGDELVAVWTGKRESHAFEVLGEVAARWERELSS